MRIKLFTTTTGCLKFNLLGYALGSISLSRGLLSSCLFIMFISNLFDFVDHKLVGL